MTKRLNGGCLLLLFIVLMTAICYKHDAQTQPHVEAPSIEEQQEQTETQPNNNLIYNSMRINCGIVTDHDGNIITLIDEDGNKWKTEVKDPTQFDPNYYYCIFFDTKETKDISDDKIIKLWREVW